MKGSMVIAILQEMDKNQEAMVVARDIGELAKGTAEALIKWVEQTDKAYNNISFKLK